MDGMYLFVNWNYIMHPWVANEKSPNMPQHSNEEADEEGKAKILNANRQLVHLVLWRTLEIVILFYNEHWTYTHWVWVILKMLSPAFWWQPKYGKRRERAKWKAQLKFNVERKKTCSDERSEKCIRANWNIYGIK